MTTLAKQAARPDPRVFRRASIKRRLAATGRYETSWVDISDHVEKWGTVSRSVDDVRLGRFKFDDLSMRVRNDEGRFNHQSNTNSFWNGYLGRFRTLVRIEAGYSTTAGELPSDSTLGIYLLNEPSPISTDNDSTDLRCVGLQSVFNEVRARDLPGIGVSLTASEIVARVRDHTDGSGNFIFREFITSTAWSIQTTTNYYVLSTDTALEDLSTWDVMSKLAESEGFALLINRTGGLEFRDRSARTTTAAWAFYGQGFNGANMMAIRNYTEAQDKHYSFFRLQFRKDDTTTSYVTAGTVTTLDPSNTAWVNGSRVYDLENTFIPTSTVAQTIVDGLLTNLGTLRSEADFIADFVPTLEMFDRVTASYHTYDLADRTLWDVFDWDAADWATEGENFDWDDRAFVVLAVRTNVDDFVMTAHVREI